MTSGTLSKPQLAAICDACQLHQVARLHAFGSVRRPDYSPGESDIDLLVEFQPLQPIELPDAYFGLEQQLHDKLGLAVDLVMASVFCATRSCGLTSRPRNAGSMKRDPHAFLIDSVNAADAILDAVPGISRDDNCNSYLIRSSVEREFTIIGKALNNLSRVEPEWFTRIEQASPHHWHSQQANS